MEQAGVLQHGVQKESLVVGLAVHPAVYCIRQEDQVIGMVSGKVGEYYLLDLGQHQVALLGIYEFEGATKKNRPVLPEGTLVYCKVKQTCTHLRSKLSCKSKQTKKEWMTGEAYYGELKEGMLLSVQVSTARRLEKEGDGLFKQIGGLCNFEVCVGVNGRVWVKGQTVNDTVVISNILQQLDQKGLEHAGEVLKVYKGFLSVN